ncbi:von Willebrand factor type A [Podospora didyma]|uniref:von Willebrand factor type A n=1 Tax=Podospora didyma TaxID=330526 RepID=A0AAE0K2B4_9PEZI|nr:von Willebrand factor type A [Podospora didyma]
MKFRGLTCLSLLGVALAASEWLHNINPPMIGGCNALNVADNATAPRDLSHIVGVVQAQEPTLAIGPGSGLLSSPSGTWKLNIPANPVEGTKYLTLHFTGVSLPGNNRIEVDLGYATDVFHASDGADFWTRPINTKRLAPGTPVEVRYITDGASPPAGIAHIDFIGIGERHAGEPGHPSFSNCDPFLSDPQYLEPKYDPTWYCADPPQWENAACVPDPADIRAKIRRSVGMMIAPEWVTDAGQPLPEVDDRVLSTCTVTLIDPTEVILAGHCFEHNIDKEIEGASVTFDYETDCNGNRLVGYSPRFYKVKKRLNRQFNGQGDWARLLLAEPVVGVAPIQLRPNLPVVGEQVFGIHHPNGAVKKISLKHTSLATVVTSGALAIQVPATFHVSGGSSGSCLFDMAGRCLGVLSRGSPCQGTVESLLQYFPSATMLQNFAPPLPNPVTKDVVIVVDRSGSMSELDGTGRSKIEVARDAVSLFVQLIRAGVGNRVGLVSFSTTAATDLVLTPLTTASKLTLIGTSPFAGGKVGMLTPSGSTSIGDGLEKARVQLPAGGQNGRAILLMTDGMENTAPLISTITQNLNGITVHAIGFGSDANLDGTRLSNLASSHGGIYTRAESGVSLQKFFSQAFGNIFETGLLMDPELNLPSSVVVAPPQTFDVCREDALTVAVGWDKTAGFLGVNLTSPNEIVIGSLSAGTEAVDGRVWTYLRVPLPYAGTEQAGRWNVTVFRPPPSRITRLLRFLRRQSPPSLQYFVNVIPTGGPTLFKVPDNQTYYTGDVLNPSVFFGFVDDTFFPSSVEVTLSRPNISIGSLLSYVGLGKPVTIAGDIIPARQASVQNLTSAISLVDTVFELGNDANSTGYFEETGVYGSFLVDVLRTEGEYTLHFRAKGGNDSTVCEYARELLWSVHVEVGINASTTTATATGSGTVVIIPRDAYNNTLGPGKGDVFTVTGGKDTTVTGPVVDNGDGSYSVPVSVSGGGGPVVVITQPGRAPVEITTTTQGTGGVCAKCNPPPGLNLCHPTTSCSGTDKGTMCTCRPGYKAAKGVDAGQWRVNWAAGQEHRVYVTPGRECDVLCDEWWLGPNACAEVAVSAC